MDPWVEQVAKALELPAAVDVDTMLDVARDVAHNVERKATPLTTYLMGVAVGGGMPEEEVVQRVRTLVEGWSSAAPTNG